MRQPFPKPVHSFLLALLLSGLAAAETFEGKCTAVADGDTLSVLRDGKAVRVRLHGVDAPERAQDLSNVARNRVSELCFGKVVRVEVRDTDRYGRLVGVVRTPGDLNLNETLVEEGLAWWYRQFAPNDRRLERLEQEAREAKRGLWSLPDPVAPWEFRRKGRQPKAQDQAGRQEAETADEGWFRWWNKDASVYTVATGEVYHTSRNCPALSRSTPGKTPRSQAEAAGRRPCKRCPS